MVANSSHLSFHGCLVRDRLVVEEEKGRNFPTRSFGGGVTVSDQKRMAKACRTYGVLLRNYPASFRREYGDTLALHFRDEYRSAQAAGKRLALLRFWIFILFDFMRSLMMEVQEEVTNMVNPIAYV